MQAFALKRGSTCVAVVLAMDIQDAATKADTSITEVAQIGTGHAELTDGVLQYLLDTADRVGAILNTDD